MSTKLVKQIIGYTDSINECDCCGKPDLKGTYCVNFEGTELYLGSVCAFKYNVTIEEQKEAKRSFTTKVKSEIKYKNMLESYNGTDYSLVKILRFLESKAKSLANEMEPFIKKYGKVFDENDFYTAYSIGHVVKIINK